MAGWSAGANVVAVTCQAVREAGGPAIAGQLLLTPVTDSDMSTPSYVENAEGYVLTAALMTWFWDHYADPADRGHPKASPLRAHSLAQLPPAFVMTRQFDHRQRSVAVVTRGAPLHWHAGRRHRLLLGDALVAQRVELAGHHEGRWQLGQAVGAQRRGLGWPRSAGSA